MSNLTNPISRRRALAVMGGTAAGLTVLGPIESAHAASRAPAAHDAKDALPVQQIEAIMQTTGTVQDGVLTIELSRDDLKVMGPQGVPFKPAFELDSEFYFQSLGAGQAALNAELTFIHAEMDAVIDAIFANGLVFMAEHQHFIGEQPQTFHIHFRGKGDPVQLAKAAVAVVKVTGTPLPQKAPSNPKTSLPTDQLAKILGGTAEVGSDGVVVVSVPRGDSITVGGIPLKPEMGVEHTIAFEPLANGKAACAPDYALISAEVNPALKESRRQGFAVHCLYNQETAESPQLYFSHNLATGDPIDLAKRVRKVLDKTSTKPAS